MAAPTLVEIDSLEVTVLVDNEVDPMSPSPNPAVITPLPMRGIALTPLGEGQQRGESKVELRMDSICCAAHGLSLMIVSRSVVRGGEGRYRLPRSRCNNRDGMQTATKGDKRHTLLFDTGPEESVWERNVSRLRAPIETSMPPRTVS